MPRFSSHFTGSAGSGLVHGVSFPGHVIVHMAAPPGAPNASYTRNPATYVTTYDTDARRVPLGELQSRAVDAARRRAWDGLPAVVAAIRARGASIDECRSSSVSGVLLMLRARCVCPCQRVVSCTCHVCAQRKWALLHFACSAGHCDTVSMLLEHGATVTATETVRMGLSCFPSPFRWQLAHARSTAVVRELRSKEPRLCISPLVTATPTQ